MPRAYEFNPHVKMVGGRRSAYRRRIADRQIEMIRYKHERRMRTSLKIAFRKQREGILAYEEPTITDIRTVLVQTQPLLEQIYTSMYTRMAEDIYPMVTETEKLRAMIMERKEVDIGYQVHMQQWLRDNIGQNIYGINDTTMNEIMELFMETENTIEFRDAIDNLFGHRIEFDRVNTIARTETASASNRASLEAVKSNDSPATEMKIWSTIGDTLVRDSHEMMDGKTIAREAMFDVRSSMMDCPADSTHGAAAEEVINCRCRLDYDYA